MPVFRYSIPSREGYAVETQWTVESEGGSTPLTVTMQVAKVTVATERGDQIVLNPDQVEPLANRLDRINEILTYGEE
jgi:hypothetical protein